MSVSGPLSLGPGTKSSEAAQLQLAHPLLGISSIDPLGLGITWRNILDVSKLLSLVDHHVPLPGVFPAAGYVKIVAEASLKLCGSRVFRKFELDDFFIQNDLTFERKEDIIQMSLELQSTGSHERNGDRTDFLNFRIRTNRADKTTPQLNALGCIRLRSSDGHRSVSLDKSPLPLPEHLPLVSGNNETTTPPSKSNIIKTLPMSYGQSGFWFMTQLMEDPTFFNGTVTFLIVTKSALDINLLAQAVQDMAQRHEGLRTAFFSDPQSHQPKQAVLSSSPLRLETKTLTSPDQLRVEIDATNRHVYNLSQGETLRLILLTESPTRHHLIVGYHHINIDGMSIMALTDDLRLSYGGLPLPHPYQQNQFSLLQRNRLETGQYAPDIAFWKSTFATLPHPLPILPLSLSHLRSRPESRTTYRHVRAEQRLPTHITAKLNHLRQHGPLNGSPFPFYVTIFQILLSRLSNTTDLCIGFASANRHNDPESLSSIGIFLNLVALRLQSPLSKPFLALLQQNKDAILTALKHSSLPFDVLLDEVSAPRNASHTPLFQAFVNYIPVREHRSFGKDEGDTIDNHRYEIGETMYDVMLAVVDPPMSTGNPWVAIMVQKELYSEREAGVLLDGFVGLMDAFTGDVDLPGNGPGIFGGDAVGRAVGLGRGEEVDFRGGFVSLMGVLDEVAGGRGGEVALRDTSVRVVLYEEMMGRSRGIARGLLRLGVPPRTRVGVLQEPTVDWICSMLGIWRFGGSYVPLEVTQGVGRLRSIVRDVELAAVLVHGATRDLCDEIGLASNTVVLDLDAVDGDIEKPGSATSFEFYNPGPEDEAIVLYTSGSTGVPKGISLPHRMVTNSINGFLHVFPMKPQTVLQQIALSFDVSWWQTLVGLATGGSVVVVCKEARRDPFALTALIVSQGITLTLAVPSEAMSWLQHGDINQLRHSAWEWHISAGEQIGRNLVEGIRAVGKPDLRFVNAYGPAETIIPHAYEIPYRDIDLAEEIPIGKVLPNYSVYIMDQDGHPLPAGVPGQIIIAGAGVASGYIKQPELTAARFPRDLLVSDRAVANGWAQAHLSGDRGYIREDGVFFALGRINGDTQVKLRGQRFELREVEAAMVTAGGGEILEAVCHIRRRDETDAASAFLVAHVVLTSEAQRRYGGTNGPAVDNRLREVVSELSLPQYMRPSVTVSLPSIPLNHHGKVDRKFLSKAPLRNVKIPDEAPVLKKPKFKSLPPPTQNPASSRNTRAETSPVSEMEEMWRDVLGDLISPSQRLDQNSDFFLVGGNSLLLIKVRGQIKERTGQDIPLGNLFEHNTLGKMAAMLGARSTAESQQHQRQEGDQTPKVETQTASSQHRMKHIWLSVLGDIVTADQIGPQSDFFLVGGNSLLLINIQKQVNKEFGFLLPLAKLFESSTLAQMTALLNRTLVATQNEKSGTNWGADLINWQEEVAFKETVPAVFIAATKGKVHVHRTPPGGMTVVLTGATGFLGRHVLSQLVGSPMVKAVHCVAVRDPSKANLLIDSPKVIIHYGDLRDFRLGLSDDTARDIFSGVSAIIHNGADVSFLRGYQTIRAANVLSTKTLVQLAMKYYASGKPLPHFHFVSTAGVVQLGTRELFEEPSPVQQPPENSNGYVESKWASEKYLENTYSASGIPVTIHRPSYVLGPDAPQLDVMHNILQFAEKLRTVPTMPPVERWLQFVGIEEVALDIAADVLSGTGETNGQPMKGVEYLNHCGDEENWIRLDQLGPYLERQHPGEGRFNEMPFPDWIEAAGEAGMPVQVKEYLSDLVMNKTNARSWIIPRVLKGRGPRMVAGPWRRQLRL